MLGIENVVELSRAPKRRNAYKSQNVQNLLQAACLQRGSQLVTADCTLLPTVSTIKAWQVLPLAKRPIFTGS